MSEVILDKKKIISIYGDDYKTVDGTAIRDYIHVSDLASIHLKVTEYLLDNLESNIFNCGYGKGFSVLEVINEANRLYNNAVNFQFSSRRKGDVDKLVADISKISKHINWKPKFDRLENIIKSSVEWEKKLGEKNS